MWSHKGYRGTTDSDEGLLNSHTQRLSKLIGGNVIVHGPSGSGKFKIVNDVLANLGCISLQQQWEYKTYTIDNDKHSVIQLMVRKSYKHFEIMMKEYGSNERYIVKHIIQDLSKNMSINTDCYLSHKTVVIYNVEFFSTGSQHILAVFMEKHAAGTRFIYTTSNYNNVSVCIKSRSFSLRVPRPNPIMLRSHILYILDENTPDLLQNKRGQIMEEVDNLIQKHDCHIDECINETQLKVVLNIPEFTIDSVYDEIISTLLNKKGTVIKKLRELAYVLLVNNKTASSIIKQIVCRLFNSKRSVSISPANCAGIIEKAALYDMRSCKSERYIYHLEAFFCSILQFL